MKRLRKLHSFVLSCIKYFPLLTAVLLQLVFGQMALSTLLRQRSKSKGYFSGLVIAGYISVVLARSMSEIRKRITACRHSFFNGHNDINMGTIPELVETVIDTTEQLVLRLYYILPFSCVLDELSGCKVREGWLIESGIRSEIIRQCSLINSSKSNKENKNRSKFRRAVFEETEIGERFNSCQLPVISTSFSTHLWIPPRTMS